MVKIMHIANADKTMIHIISFAPPKVTLAIYPGSTGIHRSKFLAVKKSPVGSLETGLGVFLNFPT